MRLSSAFAALALTLSSTALAQELDALQLQGVVPAGLRTTTSECWNTFRVTVVNPGPTAREARALVHYPTRSDEQFGRDVWVPARASLTTWVPVGPAPPAPSTVGREVQALLFDRSGGTDRLILPPGEERIRSRSVLYRSREPTTALLLDPPGSDTEDRPADTEAIAFAHSLRQIAGFSEHLSVVREAFLPPMPEAFDGIDHVVLAGNALAGDPLGRAALREWLHRGGRLCVMLDRVDPAVVAPILGDDFGISGLDRVGLTEVRLRRVPESEPPPREFEVPVEQVRVALTGKDAVLHVANGWPASFGRRVGRGKVVFTTLGPRAWYRKREARGDPPSPFEHVRELPIALNPLAELARELELREEPPTLTDADLAPLVTEAVGYSIIDRTTVAGVLGTFVLAVLGVGALVRRGRTSLLGWLSPLAAGLTAAGLVGLGESSRRSVPPTVAVAEVVDAVPGTGEVAARGLFAVYRPDSGPVPLEARQPGVLSLDTEGLEGQVRRRVQTDLRAWHWEGLTLPAGVRTGAFRSSSRPGPITAIARFGSDGVEGDLVAPGFHDCTDGVLASPGREPVPIRIGPDGRFTTDAEPLPVGQFVSGTVLSDRQQRRQAVYRKLFGGPPPRHMADRELLLTWAVPEELPFGVAGTERTVGAALLVVPLDLREPAPGSRVTIPAVFVPYRRVVDGVPRLPTLESTYPIEQVLRFQVPASARPLVVEKAVLTVRVRAPSRHLSIIGTADGQRRVLAQLDGPIEPVRVPIADPKLLRLDDAGGLSITIALGSWDGPDNPWRIESIGLELVGRVGER